MLIMNSLLFSILLYFLSFEVSNKVVKNIVKIAVVLFPMVFINEVDGLFISLIGLVLSHLFLLYKERTIEISMVFVSWICVYYQTTFDIYSSYILFLSLIVFRNIFSISETSNTRKALKISIYNIIKSSIFIFGLITLNNSAAVSNENIMSMEIVLLVLLMLDSVGLLKSNDEIIHINEDFSLSRRVVIKVFDYMILPLLFTQEILSKANINLWENLSTTLIVVLFFIYCGARLLRCHESRLLTVGYDLINIIHISCFTLMFIHITSMNFYYHVSFLLVVLFINLQVRNYGNRFRLIKDVYFNYGFSPLLAVNIFCFYLTRESYSDALSIIILLLLFIPMIFKIKMNQGLNSVTDV